LKILNCWVNKDMDKFKDLVGRKIKSISVHPYEVHFELDKGERYRLYHSQDCCETVGVNGVFGDISSIVGGDVTQAIEEVFSDHDPEGYVREEKEYRDYSYTWSIFKLVTTYGKLEIRFWGNPTGIIQKE
jgi:hypothetical protein